MNLQEAIRKDKKEQKPVSNQFYVDYEEKNQPVNLCPDCKVYCIKRYIDGRCE